MYERQYLVVVHVQYERGSGGYASMQKVSAINESVARIKVQSMLNNERESMMAQHSHNLPTYRVEYVISTPQATVYDGTTLEYVDLEAI